MMHPAIVTLIPGDGIGPEVIDATCRVLAATGTPLQWETYQVGVAALERGQPVLPDDALAAVRRNRVALKGPVSTPAGRAGFRSVNVAVRRALGLFAQVRPCRTHPGVRTAFPGVDLVVIRDTTEDLYAGVEFEAGSSGAAAVIDAASRAGQPAIPSDAGLSVKFASEGACRRLVEFAFDYAIGHGRRKVTAVHKATVMRCTDAMFLDVATEVAAGRDVEFDHIQVDNLCGQLVRRPQDFDVLVTGNLYGDILSDLAAGLIGGIGMAPGANYGPGAAVFEPAHGTAPRHAGRGVANPVASILSGALLLEHLGELEAARRLEAAVTRVVADGSSVTYDLWPTGRSGAAASTAEMADAIVSALDHDQAQTRRGTLWPSPV